jgi:hypothetical protein
LRFENEGTTVGVSAGITHKVHTIMISCYIEVEMLFPLGKRETTGEYEPTVSHSEIGASFYSLPKHVRRLVGNIPQLTRPTDFDPTEPQDLIVATDGSALFDVGYHSWVVSTKDKGICVSRGINIRSVRFVCDSKSALKRCNQKLTKSVFHNTEGYWDFVSTYRDLKKA